MWTSLLRNFHSATQLILESIHWLNSKEQMATSCSITVKVTILGENIVFSIKLRICQYSFSVFKCPNCLTTQFFIFILFFWVDSMKKYSFLFHIFLIPPSLPPPPVYSLFTGGGEKTSQTKVRSLPKRLCWNSWPSDEVSLKSVPLMWIGRSAYIPSLLF